MEKRFPFSIVARVIFFACVGFLMLCASFDRTGMGTAFWMGIFVFTWGFPLGAGTWLAFALLPDHLGLFNSSLNQRASLVTLVVVIAAVSYFQWFYLVPRLRTRLLGTLNIGPWIPLMLSAFVVGFLIAPLGMMFSFMAIPVILLLLGIAAAVSAGEGARGMAFLGLILGYLLAFTVTWIVSLRKDPGHGESFLFIFYAIGILFSGVLFSTLAGFWKRRKLRRSML